ncbi:MAG: excisionase family DNA binding protein [Lysobacterales bacterium]|jgi:excisionase family DNA binding protein
MKRHTLTTKQISEYCHVTQRAVGQWINKGKLKSNRTPGKHIRVDRHDFLKFLKAYKMPIPSDISNSENYFKKKVLIVEDEVSMVHAIKRVLDGKLFEKCVAHDGFTAGFRFNQFQPDLVLLDIKMPGFDGFEVCANIRKCIKNNSVKILIISGCIDDEGIKRVKSLGANDVLTKPFSNTELLQKVNNLLGLTIEQGF